MIKKILGWAAIAFAIYYLATDPAGAAAAVTGSLHLLRSAGVALGHFLGDLRHAWHRRQRPRARSGAAGVSSRPGEAPAKLLGGAR